MKTLVVAPQPFYSSRGTPLSVYYRSLVMAEHGVPIDLLTYGSGQDVAIPHVRVIRIPRLRFLEPIPVGPSWSKLLLDLLMFAWTVGLLVRYRYAVVHAHEEAVFWCRYLKPFFRFRLIYDMHSSLPQQLQNFHFTKSRILIGLFETLERGCVKAADAVITICPDLSDYATRLGATPDRLLLIENSIFEEIKLPNMELADAADHGPPIFGPEHRVILYAGTFEAYQGVELLVEAFSQVVRQRPDARLLLVGGTRDQVQRISSLADAFGVRESCRLTGQRPRRIVKTYLRSAQVLASLRLHGNNTPLKVYELLASGRPMVATRVWAHTQVLDDTVCFLAEPNATSLAGSLLQALDDEAEASRRVANALARFERDYARPAYEAKIHRLLEIVA